MSETAKNITTSDCIWPHFAISGLFFCLSDPKSLARREKRQRDGTTVTPHALEIVNF